MMTYVTLYRHYFVNAITTKNNGACVVSSRGANQLRKYCRCAYYHIFDLDLSLPLNQGHEIDLFLVMYMTHGHYFEVKSDEKWEKWGKVAKSWEMLGKVANSGAKWPKVGKISENGEKWGKVGTIGEKLRKVGKSREK